MALLEKGHRQIEVARMLGVTSGAVSQWKKVYQRDGPKGLNAKRHPGPQPKLSGKQRERLVRLLKQGPGKHGYPTELWTLKRVAKLIRKHFGVRYDPSGVWHVLQRVDWSSQKPERRARERDEKAIARWRARDWPRIKKRAKKRA
jgi:transposase